MNTVPSPKPLLYADITEKILQAAFEVSKELGSGFLESVYKNAMVIALRAKGLAVSALAPEHSAQTINYLKATGIEVGLLINFGRLKIEYKRLHK